MIERLWRSEKQKIFLCIDSYKNGNPRGRFYNSLTGYGSFESLSQLLIQTEEILNELQAPQSYTAHRSFSHLVASVENEPSDCRIRKGREATFELQVIFRQHTSWQGVLIWQDRQQEKSFRSVLELILLMDSALRDLEGRIGA